MSESYRRYLTAANRKSADATSIVEAAADDLTARQLGQLVSVLVDRHDYGPPKSIRDALIDALVDEGYNPTRIAGLLGCAARTVTRRVGVAEGLDKRCERDKKPSRDLPPILSFDARGGGDDVRVIRRMLWGES